MLRPVVDLHGRQLEVAPGFPRGTPSWRPDFAGTMDKWVCACGEDWWELSEDEPLTPCRKAAS